MKGWSAFTKNGDDDKKIKSTISDRKAKKINVENISAVQEKDGKKFVVEVGDNEYYDPSKKDGIGGKSGKWEGNYNDTNNRRDTMVVNNRYKVGDLIDETEWEKGKAFKKSALKKNGDIRKINKAKKITRKHVKHNTVDSPNYGETTPRQQRTAERKLKKADKKLQKAGYSMEQREEATGASGYNTAMDWATEPMVKKKDKNKRRLKEVKSSIRDLKKERVKKIGNKRAQDNLKSSITGLKEKKKELKNK